MFEGAEQYSVQTLSEEIIPQSFDRVTGLKKITFLQIIAMITLNIIFFFFSSYPQLYVLPVSVPQYA